MTQLEQAIMSEIATLPEDRLTDVLAFVRFLKISLPDKEKIKRELVVPSIKNARGMFKGIDTRNLREETDEER